MDVPIADPELRAASSPRHVITGTTAYRRVLAVNKKYGFCYNVYTKLNKIEEQLSASRSYCISAFRHDS